MTDQKPMESNASHSESTGSGKDQDNGTNGGTNAVPNTKDKHMVRILGTYSLLTFFTHNGQEQFFDTITDLNFEAIFSFNGPYARDTDSFDFDIGEKEFELRMTNLGFIREAFWKEAFPPIFRHRHSSDQLVPKSTRNQLNSILFDRTNPKFGDADAYLYNYSLWKLGKELQKIRGVENGKEPNKGPKIHIGLNKFGIANVGLTIELNRQEHETFEDLCKRAYTTVAHLQEDPLEDLKNDSKNWQTTSGGEHSCNQAKKAIDTLEKSNSPRLLVSYFQVLAITIIHTFLYEQLDRNAIPGFCRRWLADPWALSNQIPDSTRKGLPPLRHVVFIYQLVHPFHRKNSFLSQADNRRALLTLGHNVGWSPSWNSPFPLFDFSQGLLKDSSLLENSCCFIFPQGLVVVHPPNQFIYPGGHPENNSSTKVSYRDYWKLIFKLFIRVVEARLLMGIVNTYLPGIHKQFLDYSRMFQRHVRWWERDKIHKQIVHVGRIIQRTSGRVITPEITRYSFVRKKLERFMENVNFEEHRGYIQSEYERLNQWVEDEKTTTAARAAIVVAVLSLVLAFVSLQRDFFDFTPDKVKRLLHLPVTEKQGKTVEVEMEKFKTSVGTINSEITSMRNNIEGLNKELESFTHALSVSKTGISPPDKK